MTQDDNKTLIEIANLTKEYRTKTHIASILQSITLSIQKGECVALTGMSGSGKSTLLNIIGLLDTPTRGTYRLNNTAIESCTDETLAALRNQYFGFVFQQFNLLPRLRVDQNIALPLFYRKTNDEEIHDRVLSVLEKVELRGLHHRFPYQLSGGQQQRVAIARALIGEPEVILADEPTGALDSKTGGAIFDLFLSLHAAGKTLLLVTHDQALARHCQRQIAMVDGQLHACR